MHHVTVTPAPNPKVCVLHWGQPYMLFTTARGRVCSFQTGNLTGNKELRGTGSLVSSLCSGTGGEIVALVADPIPQFVNGGVSGKKHWKLISNVCFT